MNNIERAKQLVNEYISTHGTSTEMTRNEFINWVGETIPGISVEKNNLYPTDMSFNLYNAGLKDFPGPNLCLWWVKERDTFQLVGSDFKPDGDVIQYKGTKDERVVGTWKQGVFSFVGNKGKTRKMNHEKCYCG